MGRTRTYFSYNSRVGLVTIAASDRGITAVQFGNTPIAGARCTPTPRQAAYVRPAA